MAEQFLEGGRVKGRPIKEDVINGIRILILVAAFLKTVTEIELQTADSLQGIGSIGVQGFDIEDNIPGRLPFFDPFQNRGTIVMVSLARVHRQIQHERLSFVIDEIAKAKEGFLLAKNIPMNAPS